MTSQATTWSMQGEALGACSCDWGCPCNFNAPPTKGWCEGTYVMHILTGRADDVPLDGLTFAWSGHSPAAVHLGNLTGYLAIDERATAAQRQALLPILQGERGGPFAIFAALTTKALEPEFLPVTWQFDGYNSSAKFGDRLEIQLAVIKNPVTGEPNGFTLHFTNGLFTDQSELMATATNRNTHSELTFDHAGQYGETFRFSYAGGSQ